MLSETKRYNIKVDGPRDEGQVSLVEAPEGGLVQFHDAQQQITALKQRIAEMGEVEIDLHAKIIQLESEARGPEPYATWNEAAVAERMKRMDVNKRVRELEAREAQALPLIQRWLEVDTKHDWSGFQKQVEEYLGVNQSEPIPPGITWRSEQGNFYDVYNRGQGEEFLVKWYDRRQEFPKLHRDNIGRP